MPTSLLFLLTAFMGLQPISTDLYLPSLPAIGQHFGVEAPAVQRTLVVFIAAFAAAQLVAGPVADRFGRVPVAIGGCAAYLAGSAAAALAGSLSMLVAARAVQAVGVCCTVVCARAIVRDLFEPDVGARAMSRVLTWMTIAIMVGPVVGGLLQARFGWRAAFVAMGLASAVTLVAALAQLPETNRRRNPHALDPGPLVRTYAAIAASPVFRAYALLSLFSYATLFSFIAGSSFVLIRTLGLSAREYGLCFGSLATGYWTGTMLARPLIRRFGLQRATYPAALWALAMGVTMLAMALAGVRHPTAVLLPTIGFLIAHGVQQPCAQAGATAPFPHHAGAAAALSGAITLMGMLPHLLAVAIAAAVAPAGHDGVVQLAGTFCAGTVGLAATVGILVRRNGRPPAPADHARA